MKLKPVYFYPALGATFAALFVAFGYLDADLAEERRWFGAALIVAGMAIAWPALRRLAEDWKRLKPLHSVDLAFAQIALGVAVLAAACLTGGNAQKVFDPLLNPTPQIMRPQEQASR